MADALHSTPETRLLVTSSTADRDSRFSWTAFAVLSACLVWDYRDVMLPVVASWREPVYAHGWLNLVLAAMVAWRRRRLGLEANLSERWNGVLLLICTLALRWLAAWRGMLYVESLTFLPALAGVLLVAGGWLRLRRMMPALLMLVLLFPLPAAWDSLLLGPMQSLAVGLSTFAVQTLGVEAYREGNTIFVAELDGLIDAWGRLRCLYLVLGLAVAASFAWRWSRWERTVLILSALPIAVVANVVRLTLAVLLFWKAGTAAADFVSNSLGVWIIVAVTAGLLYVEGLLLGQLFRETSSSGRGPFRSEEFTGS